jgi:mRNA interferase RelE/StbE
LKTKFKIEFTPRFERRFRSLDRQTQTRILQELRILTEDPYAGKALRGEWKSVFSFRVGDYRVLYFVEKERVILLTVGHRRRICRESA